MLSIFTGKQFCRCCMACLMAGWAMVSASCSSSRSAEAVWDDAAVWEGDEMNAGRRQIFNDLYQSAINHRLQQRLDEEYVLLEQALALCPDAPEALYEMGLLKLTYGGEEGYFKADDGFALLQKAVRLAPDNEAYQRTYGMSITISRCSNNYGPKQHPEKLIPKIISNCLSEKPIPIYGTGQNIRDWLYVLDHCRAIDLIFHQGRSGETYNIGGHNERTNLEIVHTICGLLDKIQPRPSGSYADLITFVADRAGHDKRYAIDATKLETELGWKAEETFETGIVKTLEWYLK